MEAIRRAAAIIRTGEGETGEHEVDASSDFCVANLRCVLVRGRLRGLVRGSLLGLCI